jgi:integrase
MVAFWLQLIWSAMPARRKLSIRDLEALQPGDIAWDSLVPGFGARRLKRGIVFFVKFRTRYGRQRWLSIGRYGTWAPETARQKARQMLMEVANGADPAAAKETARKAVTVRELTARYMADAEAGRLLSRGGQSKKPSTLANDRYRIQCHIVPLLGRLPVAAVTRQDIERMMHAVANGETKGAGARTRGGRIAARRTVTFLGALFSYAVEHGLRTDSPVKGVRKFAEPRRERRLSDEEYAALGEALRRSADAVLPHALASIRFLALTGWRSAEVLNLRWREVNLVRRTAILEDSKTGRSMRPLSHAACDVLRNQSRGTEDAAVFPGISNCQRILQRVRARGSHLEGRGGLPADITAHVLRHSFASLAADLGYSDPTIGALIGHRGRSMVSRYLHAADAVLLQAADTVAAETLVRMGDAKPAAVVVEMRRA